MLASFKVSFDLKQLTTFNILDHLIESKGPLRLEYRVLWCSRKNQKAKSFSSLLFKQNIIIFNFSFFFLSLLFQNFTDFGGYCYNFSVFFVLLLHYIFPVCPLFSSLSLGPNLSWHNLSLKVLLLFLRNKDKNSAVTIPFPTVATKVVGADRQQ